MEKINLSIWQNLSAAFVPFVQDTDKPTALKEALHTVKIHSSKKRIFLRIFHLFRLIFKYRCDIMRGESNAPECAF